MTRATVWAAILVLAGSALGCKKGESNETSYRSLEPEAPPTSTEPAAALQGTLRVSIESPPKKLTLTLLGPGGDSRAAGGAFDGTLPVGDWRVVAAAPGHRSWIGKASIKPGETATLAGKLDTAASLSITGGGKFSLRPSTGGDPLESGRIPYASDQLVPGRYILSITPRGEKPWFVPLHLTHGKPKKLTADAARARRSILVAGERWAVEAERVVGPQDEGGTNFAKWMTDSGKPLVQPRPGNPKGRRALAERVDLVVLHAEVAPDAAKRLKDIASTGASTHFVIDWDGTLHQTADLALQASHAPGHDDRSISVDLVQPIGNTHALGKKARAELEAVQKQLATRGDKRDYKRNSSTQVINGVTISQPGYTRAQWKTLTALLGTLAAVLPKIARRIPDAPDGGGLRDRLPDSALAGFRGIAGQQHLSAKHTDPGPSFDWKGLCAALGGCVKTPWRSMIVAGKRIELEPGARVWTWLDAGGLGLTAPPRKNGKGKPVKSLEELAEVVTQIVLHADVSPDARATHRDLAAKKKHGTHFVIDWDGTIYQFTDVLAASNHHSGKGGRALNNQSVGVDLNNLLVNRNNPSRKKEAAREKALNTSRGITRPVAEARIQGGRPQRAAGYTDAQYRSLGFLLRGLRRHLPKIAAAIPADGDKPLWSVMEGGCAAFPGVVGHLHCDVMRWDPGPATDWSRIRQELEGPGTAAPKRR